MMAMPCGRKKHSNAASQSHRATGPLVAIEETVLRLRTATTNNSAKSHRPNSRRRALVGLALTGQPEVSFSVGGVLRDLRHMLPETGSVLGNTLVFYFRIVKPSLTGLRKVCPSERAPQSLFRSTLLTKGAPPKKH